MKNDIKRLSELPHKEWIKIQSKFCKSESTKKIDKECYKKIRRYSVKKTNYQIS